ncbi:MAG: endonuclease/exonuclease/phosphatase family protein [Campylobacterales bacterium]|nr:endonuclease/exonuclease/phosphatase family protein [Campylobacterales bacterium]
MRFILFLLIPMIAFSGEFKIASYNVENLFDLQKNGSEYLEYIPHRNGWDTTAFDKKLNNIAQVICDLNADIVALQEIENINALNSLKARLKRVGCDYRYHTISKQDSTVKAALLSRFKITKTNEITVDRSHKSRSILEVKVDLEGKELILFVNHWKSKHSHGTESKRMVYAKALIERIKKLPSGSEYIILGDFNSDYDEHLTMEDKFNDTRGRTGINHILNTLYNDNFVDVATLISQHDRALHYNLWMELNKDVRWSKKFYGKRSSIDSIIIPKNMLDSRAIEYKIDSFGVFKPSYLFTGRGRLNRWEIKHHKHTGKGYSDHLPIYASFVTDKAKQKVENTPKMATQVKENKSSPNTIEYLYTIESIREPMALKDVKVIMKRRSIAIIKQSVEGRGILIYQDTAKLDEGKSYDLSIERVTDYNGLKEITKINSVQPIGKIDTSKYIKDASKGFDIATIKQNEVYTNIVGIYQKRKLLIDDQKIDIFFKDRDSIPPNGSKIKINFGHIGYYYQKQIVIYDSDDFSVLEK